MSLLRWTDKWKGWRTVVVNVVTPVVMVVGVVTGWPIPGGDAIVPVIDGAVAAIFSAWGLINVGIRAVTDSAIGEG